MEIATLFLLVAALIWEIRTEDAPAADDGISPRKKIFAAHLLALMGFTTVPTVNITDDRRDEIIRESGWWFEEWGNERIEGVHTLTMFGKKDGNTVSGTRHPVLFRPGKDLNGVKILKGFISLTVNMAELEKIEASSLNDEDKRVLIRFFEKTEDGFDEVGYHHFDIEDVRRLNGKVNVTLDKRDVLRWFKTPLSTSHVRLYVDGLYHEKDILVNPHHELYKGNKITLRLRVRREAGRAKRNAYWQENTEMCQLSDNKKECCLYDDIIDFQELGWTFIIGPTKISARVCSGRCNEVKPNLSAVDFNELGRHNVVGADEGCCHPTEYEELYVLYAKDAQGKDIVHARIPGIVAMKCGCS